MSWNAFKIRPRRQLADSYLYSARERLLRMMVVRPSLRAPWECPNELMHRRCDVTPSAVSSVPTGVSLEQVLEPKALLEVFKHLRATAGPAPGADGVTYYDVTIAEISRALKTTSQEINAGCYKPAPPRQHVIPKDPVGHRRLKLNNIVDRTIASRIAELIAPHCETVYDVASYGFRSRRSCLHLFARLERSIREDGRRYVGENDIHTCFDSIPIPLALEQIRRLDIDSKTYRLIELLLQNGSRGNCGLPTGDPLAPPAMNLLLTWLLDVPLREVLGNTLFLRYVDNLTISSQSVTDGLAAWSRVIELLAPNQLRLKHPLVEPRDICERQNGIQLLGFGLHFADGQLRLTLPEGAWTKLGEGLQYAWQTDRPHLAAKAVVMGWLTAAGPSVENAEQADLIRRVQDQAALKGFRELGPAKELAKAVRKGSAKWAEIRAEAGSHP